MNPLLQIILGASALIATVFAVIQYEHHQGPAILVQDPVLTIHETIVDDGVQTRYYHVDFRNIGNATLHIKSVTTSCGCTTAKLPAPVSPGQSCHLELQVNVPSGVLDNKIVQVALRSDAINHPETAFILRMYIRQLVSVMDETVDFGDIPDGASSSQGFTVSYATNTQLYKSSADDGSSVSWSPFDVKTQTMKEVTYQTFTGALSIANANSLGWHQEVLRFVHPEIPQAVRSVKCVWNVVPKVRVIPDMIVLDHGLQDSANCLAVFANPILQNPVIEYDKDLVSVKLGKKLGDGQQELLVNAGKTHFPKRTQTAVNIADSSGSKCKLLITLLPD